MRSTTVVGWDHDQFAVSICRYRAAKGKNLPPDLSGTLALRDWWRRQSLPDPLTSGLILPSQPRDDEWATKAMCAAIMQAL